MTLVADWRSADPATLRSCYEQEARHWQAELGWDTAETWLTVEQARCTWGLPGLIAFDGSQVRGWTFYTRESDRLEVGALVSQSPTTTSQLLESLIEAGKDLPLTSCFMLERAPDVRAALVREGFEVEEFLYLSKPLNAEIEKEAADASSSSAGGWLDGDIEAAALLLRAAYSEEQGRHFAPNGRVGEWTRYVRNLVEQTACGLLDSWTTRVVRDGHAMRALVLVTVIGPRTAHIAQIAVDPQHRRQGLAERLVVDACARAAAMGRDEITLLVGESNQAARRLYDRLGFRRRATFIAARLTRQV
jgi:ribosomal protein S18 acetylase RimI-like enzyme